MAYHSRKNLPTKIGKTFMKRLSSRLDALEAAQNTNELSPSARKMLVQILAKRDSLFWPWRMTKSYQPPMTEIRARQKEYLAGIAGVSARGSGSQIDWKAAHELRRALIAGGLVKPVSSGGQVTSVILTPQGEAVAKALVGSRFPPDRVCQLAFLLLKSMTDDQGTPIREHVLLGCPSHGNPGEWDDLTERMLPALVCGAARSTPDGCGRILYSFTTGAKMPEANAVQVAAEGWAEEVYLDVFDSERIALENTEPRDLHEVFIQVGCSDCWPKPEETTHEE